VVDARLTAAALIEDCEYITKHHTDLGGLDKDALLAALRDCREANQARNRVIHDAWATRPGNVMVTLRGDRSSHDITVTARTPAEVRQVADRVAEAVEAVKTAMTAAFGRADRLSKIGCARSLDTTSALTQAHDLLAFRLQPWSRRSTSRTSNGGCTTCGYAVRAAINCLSLRIVVAADPSREHRRKSTTS
jgi:hypothetical protein